MKDLLEMDVIEHLFGKNQWDEKLGDAEESIKILTFNLGNQTYGIKLGQIREIVEPSPIQKVPHTPQWYRGIFSLRGESMPLIDLRTKMDIQPCPEDSNNAFMIFLHNGNPHAVIVDRVNEVLEILTSEVNFEVFREGNTEDFFRGTFIKDSQLIPLIDITLLNLEYNRKAE